MTPLICRQQCTGKHAWTLRRPPNHQHSCLHTLLMFLPPRDAVHTVQLYAWCLLQVQRPRGYLAQRRLLLSFGCRLVTHPDALALVCRPHQRGKCVPGRLHQSISTVGGYAQLEWQQHTVWCDEAGSLAWRPCSCTGLIGSVQLLLQRA